MTRVALLPMKASSERIRGKNFRDLCGKPLFRWMLDSLLQLDFVDRVVINTDARMQLRENGLTDSSRVLIRDRREDLRGDMVSMNRIIEDDVAAVPAELYIMTHTTNPLLSAATIRDAIGRLVESRDRFDSLFSVTRVQGRFYRSDGSAINHSPDVLLRTQDLEPWFEENSCLYLFTQDSFARTRSRIGNTPLMYETPKLESIDIDEPDDWALAEAVLGYLQKR